MLWLIARQYDYAHSFPGRLAGTSGEEVLFSLVCWASFDTRTLGTCRLPFVAFAFTSERLYVGVYVVFRHDTWSIPYSNVTHYELSRSFFGKFLSIHVNQQDTPTIFRLVIGEDDTAQIQGLLKKYHTSAGERAPLA